MDLLVLGGTRFVGRAVVLDALARGWNVTALNRGSGGWKLPDEVEHLAVDTWAAAPKHVEAAANLLVGKARRFGYVSSLGVYQPGRPPGGNESWVTVDGDPGADGTEYAADKRGGELAALAAFPDAILARAGYIFGPWENLGRLPWWLDRFARGGRVVAPGRPERPWQYVDVRDLAAWLNVGLVEGVAGPFDITCPSGHTTTATMLEAIGKVTGNRAELGWVDQQAILDAGVQWWVQLPGWRPEVAEWEGFMEGDTTAAINTGLQSRPVAATVEDTWAWIQEEGLPQLGPHGLPTDIEEKLL